MNNTYNNIYKIKPSKVEQLEEKLVTAGLTRQKTHTSDNYSMTFYFSDNLRGNEIWWWETYRDFFNENVVKPTNIFHFGLLLCRQIDNEGNIYAVSLGKSHFYLSKFIQYDFGIDLAVRMADEETILLKKSRYFAGTKRLDVSSYQRFQPNSYDSGESVDHLKLRASNKELWGERNIIFADSIQMDMGRNPRELSPIFDQIQKTLLEDEVIKLPKLEIVTDDLTKDLDDLLFSALKNGQGDVTVDEFHVYGIAICFSFHDYDYRLSAKKPNGNGYYRKPIGNSLTAEEVKNFLADHEDIDDVNALSVQFKSEGKGSFTKQIKELLDLPVTYNGYIF